MISQYDIQNKDFSISLPFTIAKISFLADALIDFGNKQPFEMLFDSDADFRAVGHILEDAIGDLREINDALYPAVDHKEQEVHHNKSLSGIEDDLQD